MSARPKSHDPVVQSIYDALGAHDNAALPGLLEQWKAAGGDLRHAPFFYQACAKKQGAGLVRLLVAAGLPCDQDALELAMTRNCWHAAAAMIPAVRRLPAPVLGVDGFVCSDLLLTAILGGQMQIAQDLLPLYPDRAQAANATLHSLVRIGSKRVPEAAPAIPWLVSEGANPNEPLIRRAPPLETALTAGHVEFALELIASGADLHGFRNPMEKVQNCLYRCRVEDPTHMQLPRIIEPGWQLLELALQSGLKMQPLSTSSWGSRHFEGFDKHSGQLHPADADRVQVLIDGCKLSQATHPASSLPRPSRL